MTRAVTVLALPTKQRFAAGDDLASSLLEAVSAAGTELVDGDVICVASKVVSLVEGAVTELGGGDPRRSRREAARREAAQVVAESPRVLVTRTRHGFVAANGGIDASNVGAHVGEHEGVRLPEDPDASAAGLREQLRRRTGRDVGVVVTDSFGRPWRMGQTEVALGVAGAPAIRDERGGVDLDGRRLEVTEAAVADEVAGASDLVRDKSSGTPFVLVRGLASGPPGTGRDLIRPEEDDLFRVGGATAAEDAITSRRTIRRFDTTRPVPRELLTRAVMTAATAPAPHHTRPWRVVRVRGASRDRLLDRMADRWREDLALDGVPTEVIERRISRSDAILRPAPEVLVPFVVLDGAHSYPDERRDRAEKDLFLLSGGAALQNLQIALAGHGLGAAWLASTVFCAPTVRDELGIDPSWLPLGMLAVGWPAGPPPPARPPVEPEDLLLERS